MGRTSNVFDPARSHNLVRSLGHSLLRGFLLGWGIGNHLSDSVGKGLFS